MDKYCARCAFRAREGTSGLPPYSCDYLYYTGKMRGCEPGKDCTRRIQTTEEIEMKVRWHWSGGAYRKRRSGEGLLAYLAKDFPNVPTPVQHEQPRLQERREELPMWKQEQIAAELRGERSSAAPPALPGKGRSGPARKRTPEEKAQRQREAARRYYQRHKAAVNEKNKEWRTRNREHVREYNREYQRKRSQKRKEGTEDENAV